MPELPIHPGAVLSAVAFIGLFGWILWRWSRKSEDPPAVLITKIVLSVVLLAGAVWSILKLHPIMGVPLGAVCGIIIGILWGANIGAAIARPLSSLYDGGDEAPPPKPFYAIAEAHRKQARYDEAIAEIDKQLELFPRDVQGLLMLAEIRCRHLGDWSGAGVAIDLIVADEGNPVPVRAKAMQALADWYIDIKQDAAGSREILERVIELFPGTPECMNARQRLAHTGDGAWRKEQHAPTRLPVPKADDRLGLRGEVLQPPRERDPELDAEELRTQLAAHPYDAEARERLAVLYGDRLGRLDWAVGEIEKLMAQPDHPARNRARWLQLLADLQIRVGGNESAARAALQRVIDLYPDSSLAANAKSRIDLLKLEMRVKDPARSVGERPPS